MPAFDIKPGRASIRKCPNPNEVKIIDSCINTYAF